MTSIFGNAFASGAFTTVQTSDDVSQYGSFTISGESLVYSSFSAVPEPTNAVVGLLVGAGLLRRRRGKETGRGPRIPATNFLIGQASNNPRTH
jgi:MYXO-CTERM domain-containing protein